MDWRIPIATGLAAGMFALGEKALPEVVPALAWLALTAVLFVRLEPDTASPVENFLNWWKQP